MSDQRAFRCYTYRARKAYYAECLDLTLLTRRATMQEAMEALNEAILCHVEAAHQRGWEKDLIPRLAPLSHWLTFYRRLLLHAIRALFTGHVDGLVTYEVRLMADSEELLYA